MGWDSQVAVAEWVAVHVRQVAVYLALLEVHRLRHGRPQVLHTHVDQTGDETMSAPPHFQVPHAGLSSSCARSSPPLPPQLSHDICSVENV